MEEEKKSQDEMSEKDLNIEESKEIKSIKKTEIREKEVTESVKVEKTKRKINAKMVVIILLSVLILMFISTIFAITNINNQNVISGVYIEQVAIYGKSKEELNSFVEEKISNITEVTVVSGEYNEVIKIKDLGINIEAKDAIEKAINIGKTNNIILDNYQILFASLFEEHFNLTINIDEDKFYEMLKNIQVEIPGAVEEYSYEINDDELIITNGKAGKSIEIEQLKEKIITNIKEQFNGNQEEIDLPTKDTQPEKIDIEKIYSEIHKEAKDAYIIEEPFELHKEENGIDLNISIEEAKEILSEDKETYTIPLKITKPKVAVKDLGDKLFKQTLAKYTTIYDAGNTSRSHNIALAAKTINGTILLPGETFSYNGILGNTNKEKGYKLGTAYVGGKVVPSYGGGICQVSSTLYNTVLYANLEIVERYNHSYAVSYVPAGRDATVAYGGKDFKFKNTRTYPVKIVASAKNGVVSISLVGIKEEKEYDIIIKSSVISYTANKTVYQDNSSLAEGKQKVIQAGYTGCKSKAYKVVKYKGKTISTTLLSTDTYKPMDRIIERGTKKTTQNKKPTVTNKQDKEEKEEEVQTPSIDDVVTENTTQENI